MRTRRQTRLLQGNMAAPPAPPAFIKKSLSKWAITGLDLSDSGFSKLHSKESKYPEDKELYDLKPEKFLSVRTMCKDKVAKICANGIFTLQEGNESLNLLTQYSKIKEATITAARNALWPDQNQNNFTDQEEADKFTDAQIRASVFGSFLHSMLDESSRKQLQADKDFFTVKDAEPDGVYFDGPSYYYKLAHVVDPNNINLIQSLRDQITKMDAKDFGYSAKTMLAEFKLQQDRLRELGDTYSDTDKFRDMWKMLGTIKESHFGDYIRRKKEAYHEMAEADRVKTGTFMQYVNQIRDKETTMKNDGEWNKPNKDEAMVIALLNHVLEGGKKGNGKNTQKSDSNGKKKGDKNSDKEKRKHPEWKTEAPKDDNATLEKNDRTYSWCKKCRNGKGLWALHKTDQHKDDFKPRSASGSNKDSTSQKKKNASKSDSKKQVKVSDDLLKSAKSYLARFKESDFQ